MKAFDKASLSTDDEQKVETFMSSVNRGKKKMYLQRKSISTLFKRQSSEIQEIIERIPQVKNEWVKNHRLIRAITTPIAMMLDKNEKAALVAGLLNPKGEESTEKLDTSSADNAKKASYTCNLKMNNIRVITQGYDEYDGGEMSLSKKLRDEILKRAKSIIDKVDRSKLKAALKYLQTLGMTAQEAEKININKVDTDYQGEALRRIFQGYGSTAIGDNVSAGMSGNQRRRFFIGVALYCVMESGFKYKPYVPKAPKRMNIFDIRDESQYKWEASYFAVMDKESEATQSVAYIRAYGISDKTKVLYVTPGDALVMMSKGEMCLRKKPDSHTGDVGWDEKTFDPTKIFTFNLKTKVFSVNMVFVAEKPEELNYSPEHVETITEAMELDEAEYRDSLAVRQKAPKAEDPVEEPQEDEASSE